MSLTAAAFDPIDFFSTRGDDSYDRPTTRYGDDDPYRPRPTHSGIEDHHSGFNTKLLAILLPTLATLFTLLLIAFLCVRVNRVKKRVERERQERKLREFEREREQEEEARGRSRRRERDWDVVVAARSTMKIRSTIAVIIIVRFATTTDTITGAGGGGGLRGGCPLFFSSTIDPKSATQHYLQHPTHPTQPHTTSTMSANPQYQDKDASSVHIGGRPGVVYDAAEEFVKNPPLNVPNLTKEEQDRASDLVGSSGTEPIDDKPQSEAERKRVQELADKLNK
ncbi:hypothetical protein JCM11251_005672 [Rhodosporidiobolus azoricus]